MLLKLISILLLTPLLLGATSSSNSTFVFEFSSPSASSAYLLPAAIYSLEKVGFRQVGSCCSNIGIELQYANHPVFVEVSSSAPGRLQLSFKELRGGCSNVPEVAGTKDAVASVRSNLEAQFGPGIVRAAHAANQNPQSPVTVDRDASQATPPLAPRTSP